MTLVRIKDEVKKPTVKITKTIVPGRKEASFDAAVLCYAATRNLVKIPALLKAASGTRLSPNTVIKRCSTFSGRAFIRSKSKAPIK